MSGGTRWLFLLAAAVLVMVSAAAYLMMAGPRMYEQAHIREFQAVMPPAPAGSVPVEDWPPPLPSSAEAAHQSSPLELTAANAARGRAYYSYYCLFCHGESGAGDGPVGESYVPRPADLRSAKIAAYSDGELLRASLLGTGHEPVLERVVRAQQRWYLVAYLRQLQGQKPSGGK
jgi:cytochrome c553